MFHLAELFFQLLCVFHLHIFHDDHGEGAHSKFVHQNILAAYGFQGVRQITQQIVIDPGLYNSKH